jgi:hypothetical protein
MLKDTVEIQASKGIRVLWLYPAIDKRGVKATANLRLFLSARAIFCSKPTSMNAVRKAGWVNNCFSNL